MMILNQAVSVLLTLGLVIIRPLLGPIACGITTDITVPLVDCVPKQTLELPYRIPGTTLEAVRLAYYEGPFVEDASYDEVVGTAALLLRNTGTELVQWGKVVLRWNEGAYTFLLQTIPAGETVLVLEQSRQPYLKQSWIGCIGWQQSGTQDLQACRYLTVTPTGMGELTIENISDRSLKDIRIYYKGYLSPPGILVGGITFCTGIGRLEPGETVQLMPWHYARDYSRVISIECRIDKD